MTREEKLEALINSLIKMGWKPWGIKVDFSEYKFGKLRFIKMSGEIVRMCTLRELVSLESGLWRFVCMHSLISEKADIRDYREDSFGFKSKPIDPDGEYRIIRSALVPEEELVEFLVENIKIEGITN